MKKTFLAKRNALLSSRSISWGVFALGFSLLMLAMRLAAPDFFLHLLAPISRASDVISLESHTFFSNFSNAAALAKQNEKLVDENAALAAANQALTKKIENVEALRSASGMQKNTAGILAGVVARPPESPYDILLLAAGENEGVSLGQEAFGSGSVPIGIIVSVQPDFSRVALFSASGMLTSGWAGRKDVPITIKGEGGGAMQASIARSAGVALGDIIFVPGPGMLPIGSIVRIDDDPSSPGVVAHIRSAVNLFGVAWVELRQTGIVPSLLATSTKP